MKKETYINHIIRYLNNQMEEGERVGFEQELDKNEELSHVYYSYISRISVRHELNELVKKDSLNMKSTDRQSNRFKTNWVIKIAAMALMIVIPSVFLLNHYLFSSDTLINEANMKYYGEASRGNGETELNRETMAFSLYQNKQYREAAKVFHNIADTSVNAARYELYTGICMLWSDESSDMDTAMFHLQRAIQANNQYSRAAQWYYALALYEVGQKEEAKKIFLQFANDSSNFKKSEAINIIVDKY